MIADVFTDGSCVSSHHDGRTSGARGFGGWCAVIEHGHDGWTVRGSEENTTAVRMELRAVADGLATLPACTDVRLWFDCTVILSIRDRLERDVPLHGRDGDLWQAVAAQFDRLGKVELRLIEKRERIPQHQRCHAYAGVEAKQLRERIQGKPKKKQLTRDDYERERLRLLEQSLPAWARQRVP